MTYDPRPIDTSGVELPASALELVERLAENTHDVWARLRISQGWSWGPKRDDEAKTHPCLVPYAELPESEKAYDRDTALEVLRVIVALGYRLEEPE